jgi:23S rRNA (uracil-5-)-methyltransferase RumA
MVEPLCPYFGTCGGCSSQNTEYQYQLKDKKRQLTEAIDFYDVSVHADAEYFYRNRMDFIFHKNGIGLREKGQWNRIVDIAECVISEKKINVLITEIRSFFKDVDYFDLKKNAGTFRYAVIRTAEKESAISFVLNEDSSRLSEAIEQIKAFAEKSSAENIAITYVPSNTDMSISSEYFMVKGNDMLQKTYLGKTLWYSIQGFFQNNHVMAEKMHAYVRELLQKSNTQNSHLLDLYAGVGTFGVINADLFKTVTIIESVQSCIDAANKNIEVNGVKNATAKVLDAKNIKKLSLQQPLIVITDPPRSGMDERTIHHLNSVKPKTIIYISCNVQQLQKDIPKFKEYSVKSAALFDLFPQTPHSEAIVELVLK